LEDRVGGALERLRALVEEQGGLLADLLSPTPTPTSTVEGAAGPAQIAVAGPRAAGSAAEYELLLEAIYEGYLLHYGTPRVLYAPEADLSLLAGDQLYALGLARLVQLGDLAAVEELADVITLTALAHGADRADLAGAIWTAGARAVGWGPSDAHGRAKELARAGEAEALEAMRAAAQLDRR
jgi:hypothetical protein